MSLYFNNYRNMETRDAISALAALAHESRLAVFRLLVEAGPEGRAAGDIGARLGVAPATLSFHLTRLAHAGLVGSRRDGRSIIYAARFDAIDGLMGYLLANCCQAGAAARRPTTQARQPQRISP